MAVSPTVQTLVANTALTVNFAAEYPAIRIIPLSVTDTVYVSQDGSTAPTVAGDGFYACPMGAQTTVKMNYQGPSTTTIKLISSGAGTVVVEGLRDESDENGDVHREFVNNKPYVNVGQLVAGTSAHSNPVSGNPNLVAGKATTTIDTTLVDGDVSDLFMTTAGQLIVKPYQTGENDWQFNGILTTTSTSALKAAGAASVRNYVTGIQFLNTSATATDLQILDGASVIWRGMAPASMITMSSVTFATPLRGTAATAMNVGAGTTAANVYVNAQGYQSF